MTKIPLTNVPKQIFYFSFYSTRQRYLNWQHILMYKHWGTFSKHQKNDLKLEDKSKAGPNLCFTEVNRKASLDFRGDWNLFCDLIGTYWSWQNSCFKYLCQINFLLIRLHYLQYLSSINIHFNCAIAYWPRLVSSASKELFVK